MSALLAGAFLAPAAASPAEGPYVFFGLWDREARDVAVKLRRAEADGMNSTLLVDDALRLESVTWTPDGQKIICVRRGMAGEAQVIKLEVRKAGGALISSADLKGPVLVLGGMVLLPGGKRVGFSRLESARPEVKPGEPAPPPSGPLVPVVTTLDLETQALTRLGEGAMPVWSPDGKQILYTELVLPGGPKPPAMRLGVMDADGKNAKPLLAAGTGCADFSPDGQKIVYVALRGDKTQICLADADGSKVIPLTPAEAFVAAPRFLPDGKTVVYLKHSRERTENTLWSVTTGGLEIRQISPPNKNVTLVGEGVLFPMRLAAQPGPKPVD